jgi:hypothetical protein
MKHLFFVVAFFSCCHLLFADKRTTTIIIPHSLGINAARELAGWQNIVNISSAEEPCRVFAINPEVTLSFRPERIAQCFFGDAIVECKNILTISGSQSPDRTRREWLADYFGLPTDFKSCVEFQPRVSNVLIDFDTFIGLDKYASGLYIRAHIPVAYTRWDLGMCESLVTTGSNAHDAGYFNATGIPHSQLVHCFTDFINGTDTPKATGLTFNKLAHAKMNCSAQRLVKISDIQLAIGWNALHNPRYHVGGNLRITIPTGNRPTGEFLFEPIIGNGHHWEVGGGLSAHIVLWENEDTQEHAGIYFDCNITHMFSNWQQRSFDLCNKSFNSCYMLAEQMTSDIQQKLRGNVDGELIEPIAQYNQEVTTVANLTTLPITVSVGVQADLALLISYTKEKNSWGFGYGFWGRSCEKICLCGLTPFDLGSWALKGDAMVFGFEENMINTPVALSATQSNATIHNGLDFERTGAATPAQVSIGQQNLNVDNAAPAFADSNDVGIFSMLQSTPGGPDQIRTSIQPILLTTDDIDLTSAQTRGHANKVFSHFTHIVDHELQPYLSLGAEIEFGQNAECNNAIKAGCIPCVNTALSFWGVWIKSGIVF